MMLLRMKSITLENDVYLFLTQPFKTLTVSWVKGSLSPPQIGLWTKLAFVR